MAGFHQHPLSATLGPPGVYRIIDDAEVHVLNAATLQHGYKESFEAALGISEAKEVDLSLVHRRELWEGKRGESLFEGVWQQLQAAQAAQLDRQRAGQVYDVALGAADVTADISTESDAFPQPPREFRPPLGLGEVAVRAAHARLRALQSRWEVQPQRQWFKELARDTLLPILARSMFPAHPADPPNLAWLAEFQVPPLRAAWYIRIHTIHRGEWHKGEDRFAVRSRLWTGDLLRALDEVLDQALPYTSPGSSPPPQPATPPLPDEQDIEPAEAGLKAWPFASDRPWVVPELRAAFPPSTGSRWHYYLSLAGYTYREGLVDANMLVSWLLNHMGKARRSPAVMVCLLPLLQLCMKELLQSQLLVRHLLDICSRYLATTFALLPEGNASQRMHAGAKVGVGLTLTLRYVLVHCPQSLIALDLKPIQAALDATGSIEDHTCAGLTAAAARGAVSAIADQATALGCAVNVRVLSYDEAAAVQALEDAMLLMGSAHALQTLHRRLDHGVPSAEFPSLVVHLACNWACSPSIPSPPNQCQSGSATDGCEPKRLPGALPLRRLFVLDIIRQLAAHLRRQHSQEAAAQLSAGVSEPVLQEAVLEWLGEPQTSSRLEEAAAELVVDIATSGLFCPGRYLSTLLARGLLDETRERPAGSSARHRAFLRHLHPQLHLPTLAPQQPSQEKAFGPPHTQAPKTLRAMSMADAESGPPSTGNLQEKTVASRAAETAPVLLQQHLSSDSINEGSAASKRSAPELGLRRRSRSQHASGGERWSWARVEYARGRSVALRGVGAKRKCGVSIAWENSARASSEEGTPASLQTKRSAGSKRKRRNRSTSGEGTPDEADELCAEWARKASACQPIAKCAECSCMEKSPSPDATPMGSSEADRNSSHDGASRSTESPQDAGDRASQRPVFRTVQKRVAAAMNLELQAPSATPLPDLELLSSISRMRPWERRCLARWLANEMRIALMWDGKTDTGRDWHRGDGWLLRGLAVMEEAGGLTEAAALLVLLISRMLRLRRLALQPSGGPDRMWQETGVSERCLLAALAARSRNFAAMGCLAKVLSAVTAWAFAKSGTPLTKEDGVHHFGEATTFAATVLCAYRANPGTAQWWSILQKTHPQHWLTGLLAARLSSTSTTTDSVPVVALLPATCQLRPMMGSATSAGSAQVLEETCAVLRSSDCMSQVETVAGKLAGHIGAAGAADARLPDTEPSGVGAICGAIVSSYLCISKCDPEGVNAWMEGGGTAEQREAHMQCLGHVSFMMRRQGHQCVSDWVQRSICSALMTAKEGGTEAENAALFAAQSIVRGLVDMRCLLSQLSTRRTALGPSLVSKMLTSACMQTAAGLGAGVELELRMLNLHQSQLSFQVVWDALGEHLMAEAERGRQQGWLQSMAVLQHVPIQACLLSKPRLLYEQLSGFPVQNPDVYAPLAAATALVMGQVGEDGVAEGRMSGLLKGATAENAPVSWLLLRCLLDDQLMTAARKRMDGRRAREAAARAFAEANAGAARIGEVEKTLTSQVLATLLEKPEKGALLARLTWALGHGIGEYLLQQADWLLQDSSSLLGHMSLGDVLRKRCGVPGTEPEAACCNPTVEEISLGFAELALTGLALSDQSRQRDFALQIVQQLQMLGGLLKAPKQDLGLLNAPSAASDALLSKALGEEVDANAARKPRGFGGGLGALRAMRLSAKGSERHTVGSAEGVTAAIALRLTILLPLLPIVYADREADRTKNLRYQLARALPAILASPLLRASFSRCCGRESKAGPGEGKTESLFGQLLAVMHALLSPEWATWLRGSQDKLRDVPAYEDSASLAADIKVMGPPIWLRDVLHSALHAIPAPLFALLPAAPDLTAPATATESPSQDGPGSQEESNITPSSEVAADIDPWFFDGGFAEGLCAAGQPWPKAPHWLQGALRRRPERSI
ncbi:g6897 [Coccomyxa elongata]